MKKLTYLVSAVAAAVTGSAYAEVSLSGSGGVAYLSKATTGDNGNVVVNSAVNFGLSTTAANGMGIAAGYSLTITPSADQSGPASGGGNKLTFTTGGSTIVVGDIELADTYGSVGGVVGGVIGDGGGTDSDVATGFADDDGTGVSLSTGVGGATISVGHIFNTGANTYSSTESDAAMTAFTASMPVGPATVGFGVADGDAAESSSGATVSMALGGGTLTLGYSSQTLVADTAERAGSSFSINTTTGAVSGTAAVTASADDLTTGGDSEVIGATYSMSLDADTTVKVGYQNAKDADSESHTRLDASISRSLGGGASVYLDIRSLSGDADTSGTDIAVGTSVSF
jgi:hypothetical protein